MLFVICFQVNLFIAYKIFLHISQQNISYMILLPLLSFYSTRVALAFLTEIPCLQRHKEPF